MNVTIRLQLGNKLAVNLRTIGRLCHCLASLGGSCSSSSSSLHLFSHRAFWFSWRKYFALYSTKLLLLANKEHFNRCVGKLGLWRAKHFSETCQFDEASNRTMDTLRGSTSAVQAPSCPWTDSSSTIPIVPMSLFLEHALRYCFSPQQPKPLEAMSRDCLGDVHSRDQCNGWYGQVLTWLLLSNLCGAL